MDTDLDFSPDHTPDWELQTQNDTCAVVSEMSIINQFGHDLTQDEAAYISASHGWYMPGGGTSPDSIGNMMDLYGIDNHTNTDASVFDLAQELQAGHGVIVGVNSEELWASGPLEEMWLAIKDALGLDNSMDAPADHAVVVTGIDVSDPGNPQVVINDSGNPNGAGAHYPLDKFMDAWENSDFYYTATDDAMPGTDAGMLDNLDFSQWLGDVASDFVDIAPLAVAGGAVVGALDAGADLSTAVDLGLTAGSFVEELFNSPDTIDMI